eukprot:CAMPEP_0179455602 /NCGR_PEP_ID=MMETSP0799-20121207/39522_1 /TAXON_ID=46947 /ORGANISM="Geminigera cryophila, Strain CCMP2564" /LENGTH=64 /DNA_ID=CAMNT_0021254757 /DNA_START=302 /DNA_END=493 /DNA_ORIENTATION=-
MSCAKGAAEEEAGDQNGGVQNSGKGLSGERLCSFGDSFLTSSAFVRAGRDKRRVDASGSCVCRW